MKKCKSWVKPTNASLELAGIKKVDFSLINEVSTGLPQEFREEFPCTKHLTQENNQISIKLSYNNQFYEGKIDIDIKNRTRLWVKSKELKDIIQATFTNTALYIESKKKAINQGRIVVPNELAEYIEFYRTKDERVYRIELITRGKSNMPVEYLSNNLAIDTIKLKGFMQSKGMIYDYYSLSNFYLSLKSKPFVILSGISGTGKSKLVRLFAEAINAKFELIPVRPDWSDATELLGYKDINQVFHPGKLTQIIMEAKKNPDRPYIICLDEMNLARVEYYFSDFLSLIESRHWEGESIVTDCLSNESAASGESISIPDNLYIVGTVNMDETTFQFSKKVLDRANTIELSDVDLTYSFEDEEETVEIVPMAVHNNALRSNYLILRDCKAYAALAERVIGQLITLNEILKPCQLQFAYRVRDEIIFYMAYNEEYDLMSEEEAFDYQLLQKVLPRINGTSLRLRETLVKLLSYCVGKEVDYQGNYDLEAWGKEIPEGLYPRSAAKLLEMLRRYDEDGFTSFWF